MTTINNSNSTTFPVLVVIERKDDEEEFEHIVNVWITYGERPCSDIKEVYPRTSLNISNAFGYYRFERNVYFKQFLWVEFTNEKEAHETIVVASLTENYLLALRFDDQDRHKLEKIGEALNRFLDARADLANFEDGIRSYDYMASEAGIVNSNFEGWDSEKSEIRRMLEAEEDLFEAHINSLIDSLILRAS